MSRKKQTSENRERGSTLLWDCFENWALTLEKVEEKPDKTLQTAD